MKRTGQWHGRIDPDEWTRFKAAAALTGVPASAIVRDLIVAAMPYIERYCASSRRWFPPRLEPDTPGEVTQPGLYPLPRRSGRAIRAAEPPAPRSVHSATKP